MNESMDEGNQRAEGKSSIREVGNWECCNEAKKEGGVKGGMQLTLMRGVQDFLSLGI